MTTRTRYPVKCSCGHVGAIRMSENDQPYSKQWESYNLEELEGSNGYEVDGFAGWEKVFKELKPTCPKCKTALTLSNME